jgi:hypothetical protein
MLLADWQQAMCQRCERRRATGKAAISAGLPDRIADFTGLQRVIGFRSIVCNLTCLHAF